MLYLDPKTGAEYFDSYGLPPLNECRRLMDICPQGIFSGVVLQEDTLVCGQYCILFLLMRSRGRSFTDIVHTLRRPDNDGLAHSFVKRLFYRGLPFR